MNVYIFGAGNYGRCFLNILNQHEIEVDAFIQNDKPNENESVAGLPVIGIADIKEFNKDDIVFLAISNNDVKAIVRANTVTKGLSPDSLIDVTRYIEKSGLLNSKRGAEKYCFICGNHFSDFDQTGNDYTIFEKFRVVGGGVRKGRCPKCGCIDRTRWVIYALAKYTDIFRSRNTVLHFAPEEPLEKMIRANSLNSYISADIMPGRAMWATDITNIEFPDGMFSYVIANHVIEHIPDINKAINELMRVSKPDGTLVLSFPICYDIDTREETKTLSDDERIALFGQNDHVRLFGRDFKERLESYNLEVTVLSPKNIMTKEESDSMGFIYDDTLILCKKDER